MCYTSAAAMNKPYDPNTADFTTLTIQYYIRCWTSWNSRCTRREFWLGGLGWALFCLPFVVLDFAFWDGAVRRLDSGNPFAGYTLVNWIICILLQVLFFVPGIGACVRRLHDVGMSGWWCAPLVVSDLLDFISKTHPFYAPAFLIYFATAIVPLIFVFCDSVPGTNAWGSSPKYKR